MRTEDQQMRVTYGDAADPSHPYVPVHADGELVALGLGGMGIDQEAAETVAAEAVRRGGVMTPGDVEEFLFS